LVCGRARVAAALNQAAPVNEDGDIMANDQALSGGHPDMDYAEHEKTYQLFLFLLKYGAIAVVAVIIFLALMWG
jgi:hypothetical protein